MKWNLKSVITLIITIAFTIAFLTIVFTRLTDDLANAITMAFVTIGTNAIGFYLGYQTSKKESK